MRKSLFILALVLAGCGGDGSRSPSGDGPGPLPVSHAPEISHLQLSPDSVMYMAGNGEVVVSAQFVFNDDGQDLQVLWVEMPDGRKLELNRPMNTRSGTLTEQLAMPTDTSGAFTVSFWLIDRAGDSSARVSAKFYVVDTAQTANWTRRLTGLPFALNDVVWTGSAFVAVGDGGKVLTSGDGVDWVERATFTSVDLGAVAAYGSDVVAVGFDTTVLLSSDGGESWRVKHSGDRVRLAAVTVNSSQIVAGGMDLQTGDAFIIRSPDLGETWKVVDSLPQSGHFVTDLAYANGIFVAATDVFSPESDARVLVSVDGQVWHDIILRDEVAASYAILYDGHQFIAAGSHNTVFVSADGYNWTERQTPVDRVDYLSAAWNGSKLVVAGGITWWYWWLGTPSFERPVGIASADGGATWELFNIDGYYQSSGLAWGNGRFVSVGQSTPVSGEGAIYTAD